MKFRRHSRSLPPFTTLDWNCFVHRTIREANVRVSNGRWWQWLWLMSKNCTHVALLCFVHRNVLSSPKEHKVLSFKQKIRTKRTQDREKKLWIGSWCNTAATIGYDVGSQHSWNDLCHPCCIQPFSTFTIFEMCAQRHIIETPSILCLSFRFNLCLQFFLLRAAHVRLRLISRNDIGLSCCTRYPPPMGWIYCRSFWYYCLRTTVCQNRYWNLKL